MGALCSEVSEGVEGRGIMLDLAEHIKKHAEWFRLVPDHLEGDALDSLPEFDWQEVKFENSNLSKIPDEKGIYAFSIRSSKQFMPVHCYVVYVGITTRTLKQRCSEYMKEQNKDFKRRPKIYRMLQVWKEVLYFSYACIENNEEENLKIYEQAINDALLPPFVTNDFTAEVRQAIGAF